MINTLTRMCHCACCPAVRYGPSLQYKFSMGVRHPCQTSCPVRPPPCTLGVGDVPATSSTYRIQAVPRTAAFVCHLLQCAAEPGDVQARPMEHPPLTVCPIVPCPIRLCAWSRAPQAQAASASLVEEGCTVPCLVLAAVHACVLVRARHKQHGPTAAAPT